MNNYNAKSIESLDYFEHIRKYPGMYIGSKDQRGLHHCIKEIISNSIDEWLNGSGDKIIVNVNNKEHYIEVIDNARGIPHGKHDNGMTLLSACFGVANTGGKFNNATGESGYNTSGGEHGTGGKAVNALSKKLIVTTSREGIKDISTFSKGQLLSETTEQIDKNITGTTVKFYPDETVFETIEVDEKSIKNMIREFSYLCKGLIFNFNGETFKSDNGLYDYLEFLNEGKTEICSPMYFEEEEGSFKVEAAFVYNSSYGSTIKLYTNNIPQEKGTHLTGFKTAFTSSLNTFAREKKWLKEKDTNLTGSDYEEGLSLIINFKMIDPVFKGQNKEELSSSEGRTYTQKLTSIALKYIFEQNEKEIKIIFDKAMNAKKAAEAAKKAREAARGKAEKKKKALKFDSKLADANCKDRSKCEIYITEGDSASGNLKVARDADIQAVIPVRGKVLNCEKATAAQVLKNAEIVTMMDAFFGHTGWGVEGTKIWYDIDKVRYGKIIIMSDADVDGAHIKNLFYTFIWNICPDLITKGYIYAGVPPLYKITEKNGKSYKYLKDDTALEDYRKTHAGSYIVGRMKGLGEMGVEETAECLTDINTRIIHNVTVSDAVSADRIFTQLMGDTVIYRKQFLKEYAEWSNYNVE